MGSSPVLAGDTLLLNCDQQGDSFLVAVDKNSGKVRWRTDRPDRADSYSTPVLYSPDTGPMQVIVMGPAWLDAYSVETGERQWWMSGTGHIPKGVPIVDGNTLYVYGIGSDSSPYPPFPEFLEGYDSDGDGKLLREEVRALPEVWEHFGYVDLDKNGYVEEHEYNPSH